MSNKNQRFVVSLIVCASQFLLFDTAWAGTVTTIKGMAQSFVSEFQSFGNLLIAMAYLSGIGFGVAASFKLKQHKDNPNQVPVGMPLTLFAFSVFLVFLPSIYAPAGKTMFKNDAYSGGFEGEGIKSLPNGDFWDQD